MYALRLRNKYSNKLNWVVVITSTQKQTIEVRTHVDNISDMVVQMDLLQVRARAVEFSSCFDNIIMFFRRRCDHGWIHMESKTHLTLLFLLDLYW